MYYNLENVISWLCEDFLYLPVVTNLSNFTTGFIPKHHSCHDISGDNIIVVMVKVMTTKTEMAKMMTLHDASLDRFSDGFQSVHIFAFMLFQPIIHMFHVKR